MPYGLVSSPPRRHSVLATTRRYEGGTFRVAEEPLSAGAGDLGSELERGRVIYFPDCPLQLPNKDDLQFLRQEMPSRLKLKNISYHPESDRTHGIPRGDVAGERAQRILKEHSARVQAFLRETIPLLVPGWQVGTTSFRPLQEKGRSLSKHASNELVHVDAGAYGATHGDRILRFFVNVNPGEDRVWITKGAFPELYERHGVAAGIRPPDGRPVHLGNGPLDLAWTGLVQGVAKLIPPARLIDSSPYDRVMRRFHNYMKDTPEFQEAPEGHMELRFRPLSAWMVFTDMVSHACIEGQFAFVDTFVVPLKNCGIPELAPINILRGAAAPAP